MNSKHKSLEDAIKLSRDNKKLLARYQRVRQALCELVEATCNAQSLTDDQKTALDKAVIALRYKNEHLPS